MPIFNGTHIDVPLVDVVDGDTIRVALPAPYGNESIRILCLDTEEKPGSGGSKPKTPWGQKATERAQQFFQIGQDVTLEFPGTESVEICLRKYRGNFNRVLAFVYFGEQDFQETMIQEGYSPYFNKYGHATFEDNHHRYRIAERQAQMANIGVWNQLAVNGGVLRDYPNLTSWWNGRAALIDDYRQQLAVGKLIYNTRLDYQVLEEKAQQAKIVTIFTEVSRLNRINNDSIGLVDIGSQAQPFTLFLPNLQSEQGQKLYQLLVNRYIGSETSPRRSYLYVTGELSMFNGKPQMIVSDTQQITDFFPQTTIVQPIPDASSDVRIISALPNPIGQDTGKEVVVLRNQSTVAQSLNQWLLVDKAGNEMPLGDVTVQPGMAEEITLLGKLVLNNNGDEIILYDQSHTEMDRVSYTKAQVEIGQPIFF